MSWIAKKCSISQENLLGRISFPIAAFWTMSLQMGYPHRPKNARVRCSLSWWTLSKLWTGCSLVPSRLSLIYRSLWHEAHRTLWALRSSYRRAFSENRVFWKWGYIRKSTVRPCNTIIRLATRCSVINKPVTNTFRNSDQLKSSLVVSKSGLLKDDALQIKREVECRYHCSCTKRSSQSRSRSSLSRGITVTSFRAGLSNHYDIFQRLPHPSLLNCWMKTEK